MTALLRTKEFAHEPLRPHLPAHLQPTRPVPPAAREPERLPQPGGNQATQRLYRAKRNMGEPSEPEEDAGEEREADRMAQLVTSPLDAHNAVLSPGMPVGDPRTRPGAGETTSETTSGPPGGAQAGSPLPAAQRARFEPRFGQNFGDVRLHTGPDAAAAADAVDARAFAVGNDIVFGAGQFAPGTAAGDLLLAHELAHVTQDQRGSGVRRMRRQPNPRSGGTPQRSYPTISQGPIGEVVISMPDWTFFDGTSIGKEWSASTGDVTLLTVPIPQLGVRVNLGGSAEASASFRAGLLPATLRNIRVGLTRRQYARLVQPMFIFPIGIFPRPRPRTLQALLAFFGAEEVRALAELNVGAFVEATIRASAELRAAASALGLFDVATLSAGLTALGGGRFQANLTESVGLYYEQRRLTFRFSTSLDALLRLYFMLRAHVRATLLGFSWRKQWPLVRRELNRNWSTGSRMSLNYDNAPASHIALTTEDFAFVDALKELLTAGSSNESLQQQQLPSTTGSGGTGGGAGGAGAGGTGGGGSSAPAGRSPSDPIDMRWFKSPSLYPSVLTLGGDSYYFTEPKGLVVPNQPNLAHARRHAIGGQLMIGIAPSGGSYPTIGSVWPRVRSGAVRTGTAQTQFRRLLQAHGYVWGSQEADHVRDLQWAGLDEYDNLWPLERTHNQEANRILNQMVTYRDNTGAVVTVPLHQTPLNRYFRITGYS